MAQEFAMLYDTLCSYYGTYRGAVVGLRGAVVGLRGAAVGVRGAAVGNIGIPTYVISRGAVVRQPLALVIVYFFIIILYTSRNPQQCCGDHDLIL